MLNGAVLHSSHKLTYFRNTNWSDEWIETAREILRDEFERSYDSDCLLVGLAADKPTHASPATTTTNIFDNLPALALSSASTDNRSEIDRYLGSDPEPTSNALMWWTERRQTYPQLSRMAIDYLAIPGMLCCMSRCHSLLILVL